nr:hypothetical protein CFP56_13600 [Quercus suber]
MIALIEEQLFEWRDAVRDLHKASLEVSFVLRYLQDITTLWFCRDMKTRLAFVLCRIFELEAKLAILKSEMIQLQRGVPNIVILDNNAIHSLL